MPTASITEGPGVSRKASCDRALAVPHLHFRCVLLVKGITEASPASRERVRWKYPPLGVRSTTYVDRERRNWETFFEHYQIHSTWLLRGFHEH